MTDWSYIEGLIDPLFILRIYTIIFILNAYLYKWYVNWINLLSYSLQLINSWLLLKKIEHYTSSEFGTCILKSMHKN